MVAASCLKHPIPGDINLVSVQVVEQLAYRDASGRNKRRLIFVEILE